ncbi:hypothetical protein [Membranihabitans maritimus]|uniref:hypothetical protein n=1 Tax=Membranihabitans maritimus TaxID=2904244 RepID=UPI001F2BA7B2|nr:hypothetical protein [Membranihabitans maritimus]
MKFLTNVDISNFYSSFVNLDKQDYDIIIQEFQDNRELVELLQIRRKIELQNIYLQALFHLGKYGTFLREVDQTIEEVIRYNLKNIQGDNIFESLLFKKASALFHSGFVDDAKYVATELVKINPFDTLHQALLTKITYKKNEGIFQHIKLLCIALVIVSAGIYGANLLVVEPLKGTYNQSLFDIAFITLNIGVLVYVIGELSFYALAVVSTRRKIFKYKKKKLSQ